MARAAAFVSFPSRRKSTNIIAFLIAVAAFCCCYSAHGGGPAQDLTNAVSCFNNKYYNGCNGGGYRLTQSGELNVPPQATDLFCNGPCLPETQSTLNCIDNVFSGFRFFNLASTRNIRDTLQSACSYSEQRGNFNVGNFIGQLVSGSAAFPQPFRLHALVLIMAACLGVLLLN